MGIHPIPKQTLSVCTQLITICSEPGLLLRKLFESAALENYPVHTCTFDRFIVFHSGITENWIIENRFNIYALKASL